MSEEKSRFTKLDQERLFLLPAAEVSAFRTRLAEITMRHQIADNTWETTMDKIREDTDVLFAEIKSRFKIFEERGQ